MEELQDKVDRILRWGIAFSIFWAAGIGSLIAVINGVRAYKIINNSEHKLKGNGRVWWCFIIGGLGILIWFPLFIIAIVNNL